MYPVSCACVLVCIGKGGGGEGARKGQENKFNGYKTIVFQSISSRLPKRGGIDRRKISQQAPTRNNCKHCSLLPIPMLSRHPNGESFTK